MFFVTAYPRETQEMVFDAHARAFAFFGGATNNWMRRAGDRATVGNPPDLL
jgi:transposase